MRGNIRVISFDLDGVLFEGSSAAFPIAQQLGLGEKFMAVFSRIAEEKIGFKNSIIEGCKIWRGVATDGVYNHLVNELPLRIGAQETIDALKEKGYIIGCISSGVSQFFMEPFSKRLGLDFAYSNILGEEAGAHNGEVAYIMGGSQKVETALKFLKERGLRRENLASIGDGTNDIDLFKHSGFSIAFNPANEEVSGAANVTIHSKDLRSILEYF
ncbi:MAG: HAD-IB family phosphatase [Candidatus Odinarchaeota archaeon]